MAVNYLKYNSHGKTYAVPRKRVSSIRELQSGDHISFRRFRGLYWHHAIVEYIDVENGKIGVIHYIPPEAGGMPRVVSDTCKFDENVYLMIHESCLDPMTVVYKARRRLGDGGYNLFTNNCEHFAMECKTGVSSSDQVDKAEEMVFNDVTSKATQAGVRETIGLTQTASRARIAFTNRGVRAATNQALSRCASRTGQEFLQRRSRAGIAFAHGGVRVGTNQALTRTAHASQTSTAAGIGSLAGGTLIGAAVEGISMINDIDRAHADMEAGGISRSDFEDFKEKRILTGSMSFAGSAAGMAIGQAVIPVPILGSAIGATLGGIMGSLFGNTLGNN